MRRPFGYAAIPIALVLGVGVGCAGRTGPFPASAPPLAATPEARGSGTAAPSPAAVAFDLARPEVVATGLDVPWAIAFLPAGDALVTERETGRILRVQRGGVPVEVGRVDGIGGAGEGGLLGVAVGPSFKDDRAVVVFASGSPRSRLLRLVLDPEGRAGEPTVLRDDIPGHAFHTGGRVAFGPDGKLYVSVGDAFEAPLAQEPASAAGKVLRLDPDGAPPRDNPAPGSAVWTLGHRNVEGFTWDDDGRLWATEFGEATFDEINILEAGANYGWPEVEGVGGAPRFRDPVLTWRPEEASPAGVAFAEGALWVAALRGARLWQVPIAGGRAGAPVAHLAGQYGRIRVAEVAPDGALWIATSNRDGRGEAGPDDDRVIRFPPVDDAP